MRAPGARHCDRPDLALRCETWSATGDVHSMTPDENPASRYRLWPLRQRTVAGLSATAAIVAVVVAGFAYAGGFLSPGRLTQAGLVDTFEAQNGVNPGFRRNHAKGVCISGRFDSNGAGAPLSTAAVFAAGSTPVIGRFAMAVGKPFVPDSETQVRSMALSFRPAKGGEWRTGINDIPVFPARNAEDFHGLMLATQPDPATGKPDPAKVQPYLAAHPEIGAALKLIGGRKSASGFDTASYNSLNAFRFVNASGASVPVRWSMIATEPFAPAAAGVGPNYVFDALIARLAKGPVQWRLQITLGQPGDATADATVPWPDDRATVDVGTLVIDHVEAEAPHNCRDVNFDPLVLPSGIEPSDDPLLSARSAAYSTSYTRRAGEAKTPSEVQTPPGASDGQKGL
jgi:catalase